MFLSGTRWFYSATIIDAWILLVPFFFSALHSVTFEAVEQFVGLYKCCSHILCFSELSKLKAVYVFVQRPQGRGVRESTIFCSKSFGRKARLG